MMKSYGNSNDNDNDMTIHSFQKANQISREKVFKMVVSDIKRVRLKGLIEGNWNSILPCTDWKLCKY